MWNVSKFVLWCACPVAVFVAFFVGFLLGVAVEREQPYRSAREQLMALQGRVGCSMVDGVIGRETTTLVNQAVKDEEPNLFNGYAEKFMTESGAPK